jgi:hypothetical protein
MGLCSEVPRNHGELCDIACLNSSYVAVVGKADATYTCDKGQWVAPANALVCARSCLSDTYCTGMYTNKPGITASDSCTPETSGDCMFSPPIHLQA